MKKYIKSFNSTYQIIKTSKWWDPEGLNIPNEGKSIFTGSKSQCDRELKRMYDKIESAKKQARHSWDIREIVEEYTPGESLRVYYPHAIAKAFFTITEVII